MSNLQSRHEIILFAQLDITNVADVCGALHD